MSETLDKQVLAFRLIYAERDVAELEARRALEAAVSALEARLLPIQAVMAAAVVLTPGLAELELLARAPYLQATVNALIAADDVERLGPVGLFNMYTKPLSKLR